MARTPKKISDFDRHLGAVVKHRRLHPDVKMTQAELANATGIPLSNLQRREEGSNEITVSELERIAVATKTTPAKLVQEALNLYGGLGKLLEEFTSMSHPERKVTDLAKKREEKASMFMGDNWDEERDRPKAVAVVDKDLDRNEPETP